MRCLWPMLLVLGCGPAAAPSPEAPTSSSTPSDSGAVPTLPTESGTSTAADTGPPALDLGATWTFDASTPTLAHVRWTAVDTDLNLTWSDEAGKHTWAVDGALGGVDVPGLPAGSRIEWSLESPEGAGILGAGGSVQVASPPADLQPWTATFHTPDAEAGAHWFLTVAFDFGRDPASYAVVVDAEGRIRWWRAAEPTRRILRAHLAADGTAVLWASNDSDQSEEAGVLVRDPLDGSAPEVTVAPAFHHDFLEEDDGYVFLAYRYTTVDFGAGPQPTAIDVIRRVEAGASGAYTDVFDYERDWPSAPRLPCSHATLGNFVPGHFEWTHSNSLVAAADGDGWWILARYLDQIGRVDAEGRVLGVLGGLDPSWPTDDGELPLVHGHFSQVSPEGTLWVFSNGDHVHPATGSRVVELAVDPVAGRTEVVRSRPGPNQAFAGFLGDVRRIGADHTVVANPNLGLFEYDDDGVLLWELRHAGPSEIGRVVPIAPWIARGGDPSARQR